MNHLTVHDKNRRLVGHLSSAYDVTRLRRINSDDALTFLVPMTSVDYIDNIQVKGHVMDERGQYYVINSRKRIRDDRKLTAQISCQHVMFKLGDVRMPYDSYIREAYGVHISHLLDKIKEASRGLFSFVVHDTFDLFDVKDWGRGTALQALNDTVSLYGVEIEPDNYVIHVWKKIGDANSALQYRIGKNIVSSEFQDDGSALVTRMFATMKDDRTWIGQPASILTAEERARLEAIPGAIVDGLLRVNYLVSQYAPVWASDGLPYLDGEITEQNITDTLELLTKTRAALAKMEQPVLELSLQAADLYKIDANELRPGLGDTVTCVDPDMGLTHVTARIIELTEFPFAKDKHAQITIANVMRRDNAQIMADLNKAKQVINDVTSGGRIRADAFEEFARLAVIDVNASKTEIKYDERGIILESKANANDLVALTSNGIYVSTDGGATARTAITSKGVAAEQVIGQFGNFVSMLIGQGNNVVQINPHGIAAGHADFNSAPFRLDMEGNVVARKIKLTGEVENSEVISSLIRASRIIGNEIEGGIITGAKIIGGSITSDTDINVTRDARVGNNLFLGLAGATNDRRIEFVDPSIYEAYISFAAQPRELRIRAANDIRIDSGLDLHLKGMYVLLEPTFAGAAYVGSASEANRVVTASELDALWSALNGKANFNHSHTLTLQNHNHGSATLVPSGGGTFTVS
ncbi:phage tail protein [Paenibacillus sp. Marseille-Q9583]